MCQPNFFTTFKFQLLDGLVDIYMPDFKFWTSKTSERLCKARDYPQVTRKVIKVLFYPLASEARRGVY